MQQVFQFNHDAENLQDALSISDETNKKIQEIILYSTAVNHLLGHELFDNSNERPKQLTTVTGDLEKALSLVETEEEKAYLLLKFQPLQEIMVQCTGKYRMLVDAETSSQRNKASMLIQLLSLKLEEELEQKLEKSNSDDLRNHFMSPISLLNRIRFVKQSRYDFKRYLDILNQNKSEMNTFKAELFYESKTSV